MRIWLDHYATNNITLRQFKMCTISGCTLVCDNTAVDIVAFQQNPDWFRLQLENGFLVIEREGSFYSMTCGPFFWNSVGMKIERAESFTEAVNMLNCSIEQKFQILQVALLIAEYGTPQGDWKPKHGTNPKDLVIHRAKYHGCSGILDRNGSIQWI